MLEVGAVLELLFDRELEDLLADRKLAVYLVLGQAEVRDVATHVSADACDGKDSSMRKGGFTRSRLCGLHC
jgi:hypothetical protein